MAKYRLTPCCALQYSFIRQAKILMRMRSLHPCSYNIAVYFKVVANELDTRKGYVDISATV